MKPLENSDIDLLAEFEGRKSLLGLVGLTLDLEDAFQSRSEVLTYDSASSAQGENPAGTGDPT